MMTHPPFALRETREPESLHHLRAQPAFVAFVAVFSIRTKPDRRMKDQSADHLMGNSTHNESLHCCNGYESVTFVSCRKLGRLYDSQSDKFQ